MSESVKNLDDTILTHSHLALDIEHNTFEGNDANQPKGFRGDSRDEISVVEDSFSCVVSPPRSSKDIHLSCLLKMCSCLVERLTNEAIINIISNLHDDLSICVIS